MKRLLLAIIGLLLATHAHGQSAAPARLAILSEDKTESGAIAADLLTTQLSSDPRLHLLERDEIARVYREQALSAENKNYLQLGKVLGADGLLLVNAVEKVRQSTNITARFVAIKPGVVLADDVYGWAARDPEKWSQLVAKRMAPLVPKLTVLPQDAVPISLVGFHSPSKSVEAQDTEQQLQLLTVARLTREPQVFALERRKMQALMEEKDLKGDGSSFWSGAYLFEAAIDQAGYSPETITINARLTPAKSGAPLEINLSGSRTNLPSLVNDLVVRAIELLKVKPTAKAWNAADEAVEFFDEAKWHLKWKSFGPAQEAADSAWAMGKHDLDCGVLRVRSAVGVVSSHLTPYESLEAQEPVTLPLRPDPGEMDGVAAVDWNYRVEQRSNTRIVHYMSVYSSPERENIERSARMLAVYEELSRRFSPSVMSVASVNSGWKNSEWYNVGVEAVSAASDVLENFHLVSKLAVKEADNLSDLRAHVRAVADWIESAPAVHASYYFTNQIANHDTLANSLDTAENIFACTVTHGAFWTERPEDTLSTYRRLMSSPAFAYIHQKLWLREPHQPRLVSWPTNDPILLSNVWSGFIRELSSSTNLLWRLEGKAFALADAHNDAELGAAFTNLFTSLIENGPALAANPVEVLYMTWRTDALMSGIESGVVTAQRESLGHEYHSNYERQLDAFDRQYWDKTIPGFQTTTAFEQQKKYLKQNRPFDFMEFVTTFRERNYTKEQAQELLPLIDSYRSNLVQSAKGKPVRERANAEAGNAHLGFVEAAAKKALNPNAAPAPTLALGNAPNPAQRPRGPHLGHVTGFAPGQRPGVRMSGGPTPAEPEVITNVVTVKKFLPIPLEGLAQYEIRGACILDHRWIENKLVVDFRYATGIDILDKSGNPIGARNIHPDCVAVLDPASEKWQVVPYPRSEDSNDRFGHNYYSTTLLNGDIFLSCDGKLWRHEGAKPWHALEISDGNGYQLFTVNGHLYGLNSTMIFEIVDGGKSTRLLASARRRPAKSALDSLDFGRAPMVFPGPTNSLRASVAGQLFSWTGSDWRADGKLPTVLRAEVQPNGVLFFGAGYSARPVVAFVANDSATPEVFFQRDNSTPATYDPAYLRRLQQAAEAAEGGKAIWQTSENIAAAPEATRGPDVYMLFNHSTTTNVVVDHVIVDRKILPEGGCHAKLVHFMRGEAKPKAQYLLFEAKGACPPVQAARVPFRNGFENSDWVLFTSDCVFFGTEDPMGVAADSNHLNCSPGVWVCPGSLIE